MSKPFFIPPPIYVSSVASGQTYSVQDLCKMAEIPWRGSFREREVSLRKGRALTIRKEPGDYGKTEIIAPFSKDKKSKAELALYILAYGLNDLLARESIRGRFRITPPVGRPKTAKPLSNAERQRRFRVRHTLSLP